MIDFKKTLPLLIASSFLLNGCDFIKKTRETLYGETSAAAETTKAVPSSASEKVQVKLETTAKKLFPSNETLRQQWTAREISCYESLSSFLPEIPVSIYSLILERAEAKFPHTYSDRLAYVTEQSNGYRELSYIEKNSSSDLLTTARAFVAEEYPDDYKMQYELLRKWKSAIDSVLSRKSRFENEEFDVLVKDAFEQSDKNPEKFGKYINEQYTAKQLFEAGAKNKIKEEIVNSIKEQLVKKFPTDYTKRYSMFKRIIYELARDPEFPVDSILAEVKLPETSSQNLKNKAEKIFRESFFTKRGAEEEIYSAVLAKMNGKTVVIATKEFMPDKLPVVFSNSRGKIKCSKVFISDELPVMLMIPDEEPVNFTPIEVVSPEDITDLPKHELYMIAPHRGGYQGSIVKVFSEDEKYLNLSAGTSPHISNSVNVRPVGRTGDKFLVSITETIDVGDNSVVIDAETGKLVSMAVRIYNPGVISHHGKTGSIIGNEEMEIPDFTNFVRQFDGTVNKTFKPRSSIRFVRMTAFEGWKALNISLYLDQKNSIRRFTDDNNDFMQFFKSNTFQEALRSRRLGSIAERNRKPLLQERISRNTFERIYRGYMIDVLYAVKHEMQKYEVPEDYYSIYRQELVYQMKLRKAMYDYLAESVKDPNIINILHTDLTTRYNNSNQNTDRMGGSIGGGY